MVSERSGEAGVTVTVFSVKGGAKVTLITRRTADGKVYVTVQGGGEIGLEFGPPAGGEVSIDAGAGSTTRAPTPRAASRPSATARSRGSSPTRTRRTSSPRSSPTRRATRRSTPTRSPASAGASSASARTAPIPAPSIFGLEGGARIFGDAEGGAGPLSGKAEGEIGPSIGGRYDANTHQTTVYFKLNASGNAGGELLKTIGGRGLGEAELQLAVTVDSQAASRSRRRSSARARSTRQLTGKLAGLIGQAAASSASAPTSASTSTSPTRPIAEAFNNFVQDPAWAPPDLVGRFADDSQIGVRLYDASQTNVGLEASGSVADVEFGLDVGGNYKTADVQSAYYYDRETGSFVPWVECKR